MIIKIIHIIQQQFPPPKIPLFPPHPHPHPQLLLNPPLHPHPHPHLSSIIIHPSFMMNYSTLNRVLKFNGVDELSLINSKNNIASIIRNKNTKTSLLHIYNTP